VIASPVGERRARPPVIPWWTFLPLVLLFNAALGYWIVSTLSSSGPRLPAATSTLRATPAPTSAARIPAEATASRARFTEITGLEILWVAISGAGGIVDLRYRVVDEKTAASHESHQSVPAIIDSKTGKALTTQWMGHAHPPDSFNDDRNYWMLFLNPNELVERGDRVAVRLGHARLTGVRVR